MTNLLRSEIVAVYVVFGSLDEAHRIAREMIEARLAACANIMGACLSVYRWEGDLEEASEVVAIFKTQFDLSERLMFEIHQRHSYEVPAMVVLPIASSHQDYVDWIFESTTEAAVDA